MGSTQGKLGNFQPEFTFRSGWGAATYTTVATVMGTAKKQGQQVLATLRAHLSPSATVAAVPA